MDTDWKHSGLKKLVDTDESWKKDLLMQCAHSTAVFAKTFMPETFDEPFTEQRLEHFRLLDDDTIPYSYIVAYRGFMKTSSIYAKMIHNICFRKSKFTMFTSFTLDSATVVTENVKTTLLSNPAIREIFGNFKPQSYNGQNPVFSKRAFLVGDPASGEPFAFMTPKGCGQQVNGALIYLNGKLIRPDFMPSDDLEDRDLCLNDQNRINTANWYWRAYMYCTPRKYPDAKTNRWKRPDPMKYPDWTPPFRVIAQDTIKHEDALMVQIMNNADFVGNNFPACEFEEGSLTKVKSCAPELWSDEQMQDRFEKAKENHQEDGFAMEMMCLPRARTTGCWSKDLFQYFNDRDLRAKLEALDESDRFIIIDPAKTAKTKSAKTAMLCVAFDMESGIYFRDLVNRNLEMHEIPQVAVEMAIANKTRNIFVEKTGAEDLEEYLFFSYMVSHGLKDVINVRFLDARNALKNVDFLEVGNNANKAKIARAGMLLPYYKQMQVFHEYTLKDSALERQELSFPDGTGAWDAIDTAAYVPQVLRLGGKFMLPTIRALKHLEAQNMRSAQRMTDKEITEKIHNLDWAVL